MSLNDETNGAEPIWTNKGTAGLWLPEDRVLTLTTLEVGWLWAIMSGLDKERGYVWPTAEPGPNREPIPSTMPRRIANKLLALMDAVPCIPLPLTRKCPKCSSENVENVWIADDPYVVFVKCFSCNQSTQIPVPRT